MIGEARSVNKAKIPDAESSLATRKDPEMLMVTDGGLGVWLETVVFLDYVLRLLADWPMPGVRKVGTSGTRCPRREMLAICQLPQFLAHFRISAAAGFTSSHFMHLLFLPPIECGTVRDERLGVNPHAPRRTRGLVSSSCRPPALWSSAG